MKKAFLCICLVFSLFAEVDPSSDPDNCTAGLGISGKKFVKKIDTPPITIETPPPTAAAIEPPIPAPAPQIAAQPPIAQECPPPLPPCPPPPKRLPLKSVVVVCSEKELLSKSAVKNLNEGVYLIGVSPPGSQKSFRRHISRKILCKPFDREQIPCIKEAIFQYYKEQGRPFVDIIIPPQEITDGVLQIIVTEGVLGEVYAVCNKHTPYTLLRRGISFQKGELIQLDRFTRDINFLNRDPFRHVNAVFSPGREPCTTDVTLKVEDTMPFRIYGGFDNSGLNNVGRNRWLAGFICGRAFGLNAILTYQFSASPHMRNFQAHSAQWIWLLPNKTIMNFYGGYAKVKPKDTHLFMHSVGKSAQGSFRFTYPFIPRKMFNDELTLGFDFKRTNNTVEFSELFLNFANSVNLTQLVGAYKIDFEARLFRIIFEMEAFYSPGPWLPDQSKTDYSNLRPGATPNYFYTRNSCRILSRLPANFSIDLWLRGQWASANLLPSEQYGLGGWGTVRGYDERQLNMDNAFNFNVELRTPPISFFSNRYWRCNCKSTRDAFQLLLFVDYGWGRNRTLIPGEPKDDFLLGAGPGVRYTIDPWLTARYDWGFKWHSSQIFSGGGSMHYFSVIASF